VKFKVLLLLVFALTTTLNVYILVVGLTQFVVKLYISVTVILIWYVFALYVIGGLKSNNTDPLPTSVL
jgi:hypothetical protein